MPGFPSFSSFLQLVFNYLLNKLEETFLILIVFFFPSSRLISSIIFCMQERHFNLSLERQFIHFVYGFDRNMRSYIVAFDNKELWKDYYCSIELEVLIQLTPIYDYGLIKQSPYWVMINLEKSFKGALVKNQRNSIKRPQRIYTEVIFEDDYFFHHIKVKGHSMQTPQVANNEIQDKTQNIASDHTQPKQTDILNKKPIKIVKWLKKSNTTDGRIKSLHEVNLMRASTQQNVLQSKKSISPPKTTRKISRKQLSKSTTITDPYPRITYKEQYLNEQVYCNFKNILDEFNKVKCKAKSSLEKDKQKFQDKFYRRTYKKPNFYHYQEFYRQNYQAKHLQESGIFFQKQNYGKAQPQKEAQATNSTKPPINSKPLIVNKYDRVYVCVNSKKMPISSKSPNQMHLESHLLGHYVCKNKTQREKIKKTHSLNKTCNEKNWIHENQKIQPWKSIDQFDFGI